MSFISVTTPDQARDETAALYRRLRGNSPEVPNYGLLFSHHPALMEPIRLLMERLRDSMQPRLWQLVNFAAALAGRSSYCALVFAHKLRGDFSPAELLALAAGEYPESLSQRERAAMAFAAQVARDAPAIRQQDIVGLLGLGYSDTDIFNLAAAAAYRCFFSRIGDALGAAPDESLTALYPDLLKALGTGHPVAAATPV